MAPRNEDSWMEYQHLVLHELEKHSNMLTKLNEDLSQVRAEDLAAIHIELAKIKTELGIKAGIWGAIAGMLPVIVVLLMKYI